MQIFQLWGTPGCHLCDVAEELLYQYTGIDNFRFIKKDIVEDPVMLQRYAQQIPFLINDKGDMLLWPFTGEDILFFVSHNK